MSLVILLPAILCCFVLGRSTVRTAVLDVYLPVLLILPTTFVIHVKHTPPLSFADAAILPIAAVLICYHVRGWRWRRTDIWLCLFVICAGVSEARFPNVSNGLLHSVSLIFTAVFPYMIGRLLIEQYGLRTTFIRRFCVLLGIVALASPWEYFTGFDPFIGLLARVIPSHAAGELDEQFRWGAARVRGPYFHSILAGMTFMVGLVLAFALLGADRSWGRRKLSTLLPIRLRALAMLGPAAGLFMTQSRGPWLGAIAALGLAAVGRARNYKRALKRFLAVCAVVVPLLVVVGKSYTNTDFERAQGEQQTAVYRALLYDLYKPVVEARPAFGWGAVDYPKVYQMESIDNEYLFLAVTQGLIGATLFVLMLLEGAIRLIRLVPFTSSREDRVFIFALLGLLLGLGISLATVYLDTQIFSIFFLVLGWIQAIRVTRSDKFSYAQDEGFSYRMPRVFA